MRSFHIYGCPTEKAIKLLPNGGITRRPHDLDDESKRRLALEGRRR